jgi:predicted enzyme related to lactoylglutathione lyase
MSNPGEIGWFDPTVPDATAVRDFYRAVVGWESRDHDIGGYGRIGIIRDPAGAVCALWEQVG